MKAPIERAIALIEEKLKQKVFSIRPVEGDHDNAPCVVNTSLFVLVGLKNPLAMENEVAAEWEFYSALSKSLYDGPFPRIYVYFDNRTRVETYELGEPPFQDPLKKESDALTVVSSILELQSLGIVTPDFNLLERFRYYKARAKHPLPASFEAEILTHVSRLRDQGNFKLCHHQLRARHILMRVEGNPLLVDFGCVGYDIPLMDVASLVEENDLDSSIARACLRKFNCFHTDATYSYEDLEALVLFLDAYWYYFNSALYATLKEPSYKEIAAHKKARFLFAFDAHIMGGAAS